MLQFSRHIIHFWARDPMLLVEGSAPPKVLLIHYLPPPQKKNRLQFICGPLATHHCAIAHWLTMAVLESYFISAHMWAVVMLPARLWGNIPFLISCPSYVANWIWCSFLLGLALTGLVMWNLHEWQKPGYNHTAGTRSLSSKPVLGMLSWN